MEGKRFWWTVAAWIACSGIHLLYAKRKLSIKQLVMMMPQWCEMTHLVGNHYTVLPYQVMIYYCLASMIIMFIVWFVILDADVEQMVAKTSDINENFKTEVFDKNVTESMLLENAKLLMDNIDLEYKHCAAAIATNNELHGKKVGGEAEWATGETSSEEEDGTREIIGAHITKDSPDTENEQASKFLQHPLHNNTQSSYIEEPNLKQLPNEYSNEDKFIPKL